MKKGLWFGLGVVAGALVSAVASKVVYEKYWDSDAARFNFDDEGWTCCSDACCADEGCTCGDDCDCDCDDDCCCSDGGVDVDVDAIKENMEAHLAAKEDVVRDAKEGMSDAMEDAKKAFENM